MFLPLARTNGYWPHSKLHGVPSPASLTHISQLEESGETNQEKE